MKRKLDLGKFVWPNDTSGHHSLSHSTARTDQLSSFDLTNVLVSFSETTQLKLAEIKMEEIGEHAKRIERIALKEKKKKKRRRRERL
jgi:hypothetical protein